MWPKGDKMEIIQNLHKEGFNAFDGDYMSEVAKAEDYLNKKVVVGQEHISAIDRIRQVQGDLTRALQKKYPDVEFKDILGRYTGDKDFSNLRLDQYAEELRGSLGDLNLSPKEIKSALGEEKAGQYFMDLYNTQVKQAEADIHVKTEGSLDPDVINEQAFGFRQMLKRGFDPSKHHTPYQFMEKKIDKYNVTYNNGVPEYYKILEDGTEIRISKGEYERNKMYNVIPNKYK